MDTGKFGRHENEQTQAMVDQLHAQHAKLKARVHELESQIFLTSTEQYEVARLKKLKLRTKDQLYTLTHER